MATNTVLCIYTGMSMDKYQALDTDVGLANANQAPRRGLVLVLGMLLFLDGVEWLGWLGI